MEPFQGRAQEIHNLTQALFGKHTLTKVICITGETGIGKTALAYEVYYKSDEQPNKNRFEEKLAMKAYMENWEHIITRLARQLLLEFPKNVTYRELETSILKVIVERKVLLFLDDVDQVNPSMIEEFISKWSAGKHRSTMLLTMKKAPFKVESPQNCVLCDLKGIIEDFAIENLLGPDLVALTGKKRIRDISTQLGGIPQKLLYLRWRAPKDIESINKCIHDLKSKELGTDAVEMVMQKIPYPLMHFLALARVRNPEFEESLLAFLWDRLCGGSSETYVQTLQYLLAERVVTLEKPGDRYRFRLSAGVHMGLEKLLFTHIRQNRVGYIDYFISEYYRNMFADSRSTSFLLHILEEYVYHSLRSGNFDTAYSYVFEDDIIDVAHNRGLALELTPILLNFDNNLSNLLRRDILSKPSKAALAEKAARIKIELGHIYNDLSQHEFCLNYMVQADKILEEPAASNIPEKTKREFKKRIWYFSAISSSDLGRSNHCLDFYSRIVQDATERREFTWFDALSMGYLAHELKFHDIKKSEKLGKRALKLSKMIGHENTIIKNMCSLGQTLFFMGKKDECNQIFKEAHKLFSKVAKDGTKDLRELGRILIHWAIVHISVSQFSKADRLLKEGLKLNTRFGDRRRAATAIANRAIMLHKSGKQKEGMGEMLRVIRQHMDVHDWRNLTNEVMTYIWFVDSRFDGDLKQAISKTELPLEVRHCVEHIVEEEKLHIFVDFWRNRFKPQLLEA